MYRHLSLNGISVKLTMGYLSQTLFYFSMTFGYDLRDLFFHREKF